MEKGFTPHQSHKPKFVVEKGSSPKAVDQVPRALARGAGFTFVEVMIAALLGLFLGFPNILVALFSTFLLVV